MMTREKIVRSAAALMFRAAGLLITVGALSPWPARCADRVGGDFAIERVDLRFAGGEKTRVLAAGESVRAEAEITYSGTGRFEGAWEIAEPTTTTGSPQYRTLELVSRLFAMGHRNVLPSPPLPAGLTGTYFLRLKVTHPVLSGKPLVLRYFVGQSGKESAVAAPPSAIAARGPAAGRPADQFTFSWDPVAGTIAYQLEIYEKEGAAVVAAEGDGTSCMVDLPSPLGHPPVTGIMVPGSQTEVALGPIQIHKLVAGRTYLWRVVALDKNGRSLCESPLQQFAR